ncbi:universal stress protein [Patulibacter defluvii]|uniref:universal stress protein n=1 Tax=Patulibacter defluvii TaxID=3095358 RepID=UPI002A74E7B0|nr:universal stress protein [Patulibacter sp. DM4]
MFEKIVVGTDGSPTALVALRHAIRLAAAGGASIDVVTAHDPEREGDPEAILRDAEAVVREGGVADVRTHAVPGDPAEAIIRLTDRVKGDLIVIGNKGMTGTKRFLLGSVPDKISHHADASVLIVHTT